MSKRKPHGDARTGRSGVLLRTHHGSPVSVAKEFGTPWPSSLLTTRPVRTCVWEEALAREGAWLAPARTRYSPYFNNANCFVMAGQNFGTGSEEASVRGKKTLPATTAARMHG